MANILKLSNEILKEILDRIESDPQRSVGLDRREYLSVESFRPPSPPLPSQAQDIGNFRLSCHRFAELGIQHQFTKVTVRFSSPGLARLEQICNAKHLAIHTKKFSYLVPLFFGNTRRHFEHFLRAKDYTPSDILILKEKAEDQKKILKSGQDARVLKEAMSAFQSLQHVQILRLQGEEDRRLLDYARENRLEFEPDVGEPALVDLRWSLACYHATKTMGEALSHAQSPFNRFSGPMMNPHSALAIHKEFPQTTTSLASSLTCLELHFEDGLNLNEKMLELRDLFKAVFSAATNLQALHIGFPSRTPLDMRLEDIFHNVHWEKLRAVGIQAWYLDADEIINLARRHSQTLRGLRLRDVLLRDGSLWKDVLEMLRAEMEQLDWVSLRRIDYSKHFDELWAGSMEVPDDLPAAASDSDDEDEFPTHVRDFAHDAESEGGDSDGYSDADTDQGPDANEFALSPDTPVSLPFCTCSRSSYPASADDLGDNGRFVDYPQRKMWEKWVLALCPEHYYK